MDLGCLFLFKNTIVARKKKTNSGPNNRSSVPNGVNSGLNDRNSVISENNSALRYEEGDLIYEAYGIGERK